MQQVICYENLATNIEIHIAAEQAWASKKQFERQHYREVIVEQLSLQVAKRGA
jgi:hypothetical protein